MAEIIASKTDSRRRVPAPRIDLTPMVDLGFLLITFFVYTTALGEPKAMEINQPFNPPPPGVVTAFVDTSTVTFIPIGDHKVVYYNGQLEQGKLHSADIGEIRSVVITKQAALRNLPAGFSDRARKIHVLIKPADECTYDDVVRLLDEMIINNVQYYAMTDLAPEELSALTEYNGK